jgi:hypothetical protein
MLEGTETKIAQVCHEFLEAMSVEMGNCGFWRRTVQALQTSLVSNRWTLAMPQIVLFPIVANAQTENTDIFDVSRNFMKSISFGSRCRFGPLADMVLV